MHMVRIAFISLLLIRLYGYAVEHLEAEITGEGKMYSKKDPTKYHNFVIQDGYYITEGDIILGKVGDKRRLIPIYNGDLWPNAYVPYEIDSALSSTMRSRIHTAISDWERDTDIRFGIKQDSETDYVNFIPGSGCSSTIGRGSGEQTIILNDGCSTGNVRHEIGHTIGFWHTHTREDRDLFVDINWDNIIVKKKKNFIQHIDDADDCLTYDYGSIMHYGQWTWAIDDSIDTITPRHPLPSGVIMGQRDALSDIDIGCSKILYGGSYPILNIAGRVLDEHLSDYNNKANGGRMQIWNYLKGDNQLFYLPGDGTIATSNGLCLDVHYPDFIDTSNGAKVQIWQCNGQQNQQWTTNGRLIQSSNGLCLDVHSPDLYNNGAKIQLWQCNGRIQQLFYVNPFFRAILSGVFRCLDVHSPDLRNNGGRVQTWSCNSQEQQKWLITSRYGPYTGYTSIVSEGGLCLDVHYPDFDSGENGALVQVWECNGQDNQKWYIDGREIKSHNGKCLDVHSPDLYNDGAKVQLWHCNGATQQQWYS